MEGRGVSELYRNASEEMMMMGFKNLSAHNFRTDSEELFRSWLTNGENLNNNNNNSSPLAYRTRHPSTRLNTSISSEIVDLSSPQYAVKHPNTITNHSLHPQTSLVADDAAAGPNQQPFRNVDEIEVHGSNLYLAKAWFHSSQPMTRSRSSELRRRYAAAMQSNESSIGMESMYGIFGHGLNPMKLDVTNSLTFNHTCDISNQPLIFSDQISSVVNMLKGTLERKKLKTHNDKAEQLEEDSNSNAHFRAHETVPVLTSNDSYMQQIPISLPEFTPVEGLADVGFEAFVNPIQSSRVSQEPSQSESSAAAVVVVSPGFESCDGPCNLTQTQSNGESSRKHVAGTQSLENGSRSRDFRDRIIDNLKDERKRGSLVRYGSVTSAASVEKGDPTKKRRVERSRKMAEAKERNLSPSIPSDMQSVVKRCENLEKEVRSLKLNLSFMNRKDSEQTKQIEDLQKQNEDMADEKERLLEEIERILSQTTRIN